jgi:hypothetical protein
MRMGDIIKASFKDIRRDKMHWIYLAQIGFQWWRSCIKMEIYVLVPYKAGPSSTP